MSHSGSISVVIRVRNEGPALQKVLRALQAQDMRPAEIIVVDNASSDNSKRVAQDHGATILEISRNDFTYGRALNMGIRRTLSEFICILSAHSLPIGPDFLRKAVAPFEDFRIAAVRCLSATNRSELENWFKPAILEWPVEIETVIASAPVNCASMIRRSVWEQIPYDENLSAVEDKFWAFQVLKSGFQICNSAAVYLYLRDRTFGEKIRTFRLDRQEFYKQTGRQWKQPPVSFQKLIADTFYRIPRHALRQVVYEATLYANLRSIPFRVKRKS